MAIARCLDHVPAAARGNEYVSHHLPVSHPESGLICGRITCEATAIVWLKADEEEQYQRGVRIFRLPTMAAKVQVQ